jgi:APA family basic amino acid/polyamine antiporter
MSQPGRLVRGLGPWAATALVAGNIIGSGVYIVPASLAETTGPLSLAAWLVNAAGFLALAAVFADLGGAYPVCGGPQAFVQRAFGELAGLETAFLYWFSVVTSNAALATGFVGYVAVFLPGASRPLPSLALSQALLWVLCAVNVAGVRAGGGTQVATVVLKIAPLLLVAVALVGHADASNLTPFAPHGARSLLPAIALVSFLFLGAESATIPAEEIRGSGPTIRRAAYLGFGLATLVYFLIAGSLALGMPAAAIAGSASPLAVAARRCLGGWAESIVTLGALVSIAGALNGWTLVAGRLPFAAGRAGLAPRTLARVDVRTGTPAVSIVFSTLVASALLLLTFRESLLRAFEFAVLLSTATCLIAYAGCCVASLALLRREPARFSAAQRRRGPWAAVVALGVVALMLAGTGATVLGLSLLTMAVPPALRAWLRRGRAPAEGAGAPPGGGDPRAES